MDEKKLKEICKRIRYEILASTTNAGSGHPTSCLSAVELMSILFFGGFFQNQDKFILSKGHAAPLLYSVYSSAGLIPSDWIYKLRKFASPYEGHPTPRFPYAEVATGSLGQGLSVGIGMALGIRLRINDTPLNPLSRGDKRGVLNLPRVWVLLGDSEMAEGQIWEAMEIASYYKLNNLIGIIDVNRLGQYGETEQGWDLHNYEEKIRAFGWEPIIVEDGHDLKEIYKAFIKVSSEKIAFASKPKIIIARTIKGKGVSFLENKENWHGKALDKKELKSALKELGKVDLKVRGKINLPISDDHMTSIVNRLRSLYRENVKRQTSDDTGIVTEKHSHRNNSIATREAYGDSLVELGSIYPNLVVLDAEMANSTFENRFQKRFPDRFFEMFIAEENMMSVALGLSKMGYIPFVSTFAAFLTQTFDQIRMAQYSAGNLKIVGSHAGVSIGQDGPSQMGLEDIAMMRSILKSTVFYPADGASTKALVNIMAENQGIFYLRLTRAKTPIIYGEKEEFGIGGCKVHKSKIQNPNDKSNPKSKILIIAAGITLHEALKAQKELSKENIETVVIDCYSIKPMDEATIINYSRNIKNVIVVEDHYPYGGLGEAVSDLLITNHQPLVTNFIHLCVRKIPLSAKPEELLRYEEIDSQAIIESARKSILTNNIS